MSDDGEQLHYLQCGMATATGQKWAAAEIERLRDESRMLALCEGDRKEMADEIERLRAEIEQLQADRNKWREMWGESDVEIERLRADVAELSRVINGIGNGPDLAEKVLANPTRIHKP